MLTEIQSPSRQDLLERIAEFGDRPFLQEVVQTPWQPVVDVESLHRKVKQTILKLVRDCDKPDVPRCLTVIAPPGYGKSHLLAWTRQQLDEGQDAVFVYIQPQLTDSAPLASHLVRAVIDSLWHNSNRQRQLFQDKVQALLVRVYDEKISKGAWPHVGIEPSLFVRLFRGHRMKIAGETAKEQRESLQSAFRQREFIDAAFCELASKNPPNFSGARVDRDAFVAASLLVCGNASQRKFAEGWFHDEKMFAEERDRLHLRARCRGPEKICNVLYTLSRLLGQNFCLAFDQLEDTFNAYMAQDASNGPLNEMTAFITKIAIFPGISMLFMFQKSIWAKFSTTASPYFLDRIVEGHGVQDLQRMDQAAATGIIKERMRRFVWKELGGAFPEDELFPFDEEEISELRLEAEGELRGFLQLVRERYQMRLAGFERRQDPLPPMKVSKIEPSDAINLERRPVELYRENPPLEGLERRQHWPPPIKLTKIEPSVVINYERRPVVLYGENFPLEVQVFFGDQEAEKVICRADAGQVDIVPPIGPIGPINIRVVAMDDTDQREARIGFRFTDREAPRPYSKHLCRQKIRAARNAMGLTQVRVEEKMEWKRGYMSRLETGTSNPPDRIFEELADLYESPLDDFLLDKAA